LHSISGLRFSKAFEPGQTYKIINCFVSHYPKAQTYNYQLNLDEETFLPVLIKPSPKLNYQFTRFSSLADLGDQEHVDVAGIISGVDSPFFSNRFGKYFRKVHISDVDKPHSMIAVMYWGRDDIDEIDELDDWKSGSLILVKSALVRDDSTVRGSIPSTQLFKSSGRKFIKEIQKLNFQ
jgi:hypothetical protein